jgi:hypothetical protein
MEGPTMRRSKEPGHDLDAIWGCDAHPFDDAER